MRPVAFLLLVGCSEYELSPDEGPALPGDSAQPDTGTPPETEPDECGEPDISEGGAAVDESCMALEKGSFTPVIEWRNETPGSIYVTPVVANLTDDNGDGSIDTDDMPDVVAVNVSGGITVLAGDTGAVMWQDTSSGLNSVTPAIGDLNGDGRPDVVAVSSSAYIAYSGSDGSILWRSNHASEIYDVTCGSLGIYDLDADGLPEVISGAVIMDGADGALRGIGSHGVGTALESQVAAQSVAADLDQDGIQEVVVGNAAYNASGQTVWFNGESDGYVAVGQFDNDPEAEIVVTAYGGEVRLQDHDGSIIWRMSLATSRIGPPTIADFDGDGEPEIGVAGSALYAAIDTDGTLMWQNATQDASSGCTGSSVFDFEGDGQAEVVYADEQDVWVFDGATGAVKLKEAEHGNLTCTEYPVIVDVDNDGQAEIVYASYLYGDSAQGIRVVGDADSSWMPARRIWNQHAYNITNVEEDGTIPAVPDANWLSYNTFRSGDLASATGGALTDAVPQLGETCEIECTEDYAWLVARVGNGGTEPIPYSVPLSLYAVGGQLLQTRWTDGPIPSGGTSAGLVFELTPSALPGGPLLLVADDDGSSGLLQECHEDNNELQIPALCP